MLIGSNESNRRLFQSMKNSRSGMIIETSGVLPEKNSEDDYRIYSPKDVKSFVNDLIKKTIRNNREKMTIIVNTQDEELNLSLVQTIVETVDAAVQDNIAENKKHLDLVDEITGIIELIDNESEDKEGSTETAGDEKNNAEQYRELIDRLKEKCSDISDEQMILQKIETIKNKLNEKARLETHQDQSDEPAVLRKEIKDLCAETNHAILQSRISGIKKVNNILLRLRVVVFEDRDYQAIYESIQKESVCPLKLVNKYILTAYEFAANYPLTRCLSHQADKDKILMQNGCVSPEAEFNVIMIGFGDTNQEIFLASAVSNQLIQYVKDGIPELKQVNYHIFHKTAQPSMKNINHNFFRYMNDFKPLFEKDLRIPMKTEDYLPMPPDPVNISFNKMDVNDNSFYDKLRKICGENPLSINYIIIAFSDDLENIDLAQRLFEKKCEWGADNIHIFAKNRDPENQSTIEAFAENKYIPFGKEDFTIEDLLEDEFDRIVVQRIREFSETRFAKQFPGISQKEYDILTNYDLFTMDRDRLIYNIFNFLSIRLKLNLIGYDYKKRSNDGSNPDRISLDDYTERYCQRDPSMSTNQNGRGHSDLSTDQTEDFRKDVIRKNLAVQEHYRWNAFMMMNGYIPAPIKQIREGRIKDEIKRTHGKLTTIEGLFTFRELITLNGTDKNVFLFDYLPMDNAWTYMDRIGYDIIPLTKTNPESGKQ